MKSVGVCRSQKDCTESEKSGFVLRVDHDNIELTARPSIIGFSGQGVQSIPSCFDYKKLICISLLLPLCASLICTPIFHHPRIGSATISSAQAS